MALPSENSDFVVAGVAACRLVIGMAQGMLLPAAQSVLSHWVPPAHRGRYFALAMSGMFAGAALAMVTVPIVGKRGGVFGGEGGGEGAWFFVLLDYHRGGGTRLLIALGI